MVLHEIAEAVLQPDHTVTVTWTDGAWGVVSFAPVIDKGGLFTALKDPDYFVREMRILRGGIGLTWPDDVDFSAEGLRQDAFPEEQSDEYDDPVAAVLETPSPQHHVS